MNPHTPPPDDRQDPPAPSAGLPRPASTATSGAPASASGQDDAGGAQGTGPRPEAPPSYPPAGREGPGAPPPPYAGIPPHAGMAPPPPGPRQGVPQQDFFGWIRSQGIYRDRERWVGGVAGGVARRLGVDPLIVRGVVIVLTVFAGVGMLLYGLAWALLPEPDGRIHVQEAGAGRWTAGMTGALLATAIGLPGLGSGVWGWDHGIGAFLWTVFWLGGLGYLIYYLARRNTARSGTAPAAAPAPPGGTANPASFAKTAGPATAAGTGSTSAAAFAGAPAGQDGAPGAAVPAPPYGYAGYGPAGGYSPAGEGYSTANGAYGPGPAPAGPRNPGPGKPAAAVTAGLALLAGGGIKALDAANVIDLGSAGNAVVWAAAAAVLGVGILAAGLRGRTSGILGFLAVVALLMGAVFNVLPHTDRFRAQNADWVPASVEQARSGFEIMAGTGTVDLTRLALNPPLATDVVIPVDAMASNLRVVIPATVPVRVEADMMMGSLNGASGNAGGMTSQRIDYNPGQPGARLVLKVSAAMSNVTIQERN